MTEQAARRDRRAVRAAPALVVLGATVAAVVIVLQPPSAARLPAWYARLPLGDDSRFFSVAVPMRKLRQGQETRNAVLARPGMPLRQALTPQPGTRIEVAFTTMCPPPQRCGGGVRFRLDAVSATTREPLLDTRVSAEGRPPRWQTQRIDLGRLGAGTVTLELSVAPYGGHDHATGEPLAPPAGVWGEPLAIGGTRERRPNVLLISLDTLRADHLGSYGYTRPTSPTLDRFAAEGVRFDQAVSQSPWTTPAHMSLFTSLYPSSHRINESWDQLNASLGHRARRRSLAPAIATLSELLRADGYRTLALTGGATMTGVFGFAQGFDVYREDAAKLTRSVGALLSQWLGTYGQDPFFLFLHTFEIHTPYTHLTFAAPLLSEAQRTELLALVGAHDPQEWMPLHIELSAYLKKEGLFRREVTEALYDGGIRAADAFLDSLFAAMRQRGLYDETLIIVCSDHGEEFGEHLRGRIYGAHGMSMYDLMLRVPLLMRLPERFRPGTVVTAPVELIDVTPTVLDLLGIAVPAAMQGRTVIPLIEGAASAGKDWTMSEATSSGAEMKALRTRDHKYIMVGGARDDERSGMPRRIEQELLFDLRNDPGEQHPLDEPARTAAMRRQLERLLRTLPAQASSRAGAVIDADVHERLRALGYVHD